MFVIRAFFTANQLVFRLFLYICTLLFFSPLIQADSRAKTTALSLINKTYLNQTPQLSYKISSTSKGITATPVLKGMSPVSISPSSGINHSIQINGEEHFVTASPTTEGKGLIVQTQASNGSSAHLLKVYPVQPSGQNHSFYVKDESSGATFLAITNATGSEISLQQTGNKTTKDDCDDSYKNNRGECFSLPVGVIIGIIASVATVVGIITCVLCYFCCRGSGGGTFIPSLAFFESGGG
ncbi:hypothetical protein [Endozoicomonas euniceicola]|uniref:Uncharacterized protein n=1 Tax=Endozoicomonas euniceicola TaxID=1234143 RepID=A0ABY6H0W1_9GAMM|nr:hypothetical protein [Endozoicomonas euniceicola]UYM18696.1 hypothetical protein NX720_12580 [Endozoicomonas euniceicola]